LQRTNNIFNFVSSVIKHTAFSINSEVGGRPYQSNTSGAIRPLPPRGRKSWNLEAWKFQFLPSGIKGSTKYSLTDNSKHSNEISYRKY